MRIASISLFFVMASAALGTTPGSIGANDYIDWGQFGPDYTLVPSGTTGITNLGLGFTVKTVNTYSGVVQGTDSEVRTQDSSWMGMMAPGEHVLFNVNSYLTTKTVVAIVFDAPVFGAGAYAHSNLYGAFDVGMGAWDAEYPTANWVGGDSATGTCSWAPGTSPFIGVLSGTANIKAMYIGAWMSDGTSDDLGSGIGTVYVNTVPEPASMAALGLGALALLRRRKK